MKSLISIIALILMSFTLYSQIENEITNADNLYKTKNYNKSINLYTKIIENYKSDGVFYAYYMRAYCYYHLNDFEKSKKDLSVTIKKEVTYRSVELKSNSFVMLGRIFSKEGDYKKSIKFYKKGIKAIIKDDPDLKSILYTNLGYTYVLIENYKGGIKYLSKALENNENNAYAYNNRCLAYLKIGKIENALFDVEKSITLDPLNPYAYKHRALIKLYQGKNKLACEDLELAEELGYKKFGNEYDQEEVHLLREKNCN